MVGTNGGVGRVVLGEEREGVWREGTDGGRRSSGGKVLGVDG